MRLLPRNEAVLKARFPEVLRRINEAGVGNSDCEIEGTGNGQYLAFGMGDRTIYPYGRRDARDLAKRWTTQVEYKENTFYAVSGFGLGTHLEALLEKAGEGNFLFVGERNPRDLGAVLSKVDCFRLLNDERLILGTGEIDEKYFEPLREVQFSDFRDIGPLIFSPLFSLNEKYYEKFFAEFARNFEIWRRLYQSNIRDSSLWQEATLDNLPLLLASPDIGVTRNFFQELPVVLVGAGPSLDEAIEFLRSVQKRAIVICVNSSYRKLINNGIVPHMTLAADPREDTAKGYEGLPVEGVALACPYFVCPQVVNKFAGNAFTWTGNNSLARIVRQRLGQGEGTTILEQGTVSACVVDLARLWGCRKICLVGQDMALSQGGQTHTLDSFYADEGRVFSEPSSCRILPGNTLEHVPVDEPLFVYLKTFCQIVKNYPDITFINTARLGARIAGVPYLKYGEAASWLGYENSEGVRKKLSSMLSQSYQTMAVGRQLRKALNPTLRFARQLFNQSLEAALHLELLPPELEGDAGKGHEALLKGERQATQINELLDRHPNDYQVLFDGRTKTELFRCRENSKALVASSEHWKNVLKNREYYWALVEGAHFLVRRIERVMAA